MRLWLPLGLVLVLLAWAGLVLRGGKEAGAARSLTPQRLTVVTSTVESMQLSDEIEALGTAHANEAIEVTAKVASLISAIRFDEGQAVAAGAVLVELESSEARADLELAKAAVAESRSQYQRRRNLSTQTVSASELETLEAKVQVDAAQVQAAQARLDDLVIRAPFAGRLGLRRVSVGSLVTPGIVVTTLDDTRTIKLDFSVPESFLAALRPGLVVQARSAAYPDQSFDGRVSTIDTRVDPITRTVTVRALIGNESAALKPGMFMTVRLVRERRQALVIPEQAVVPERGVQYVWVIAGGHAQKREVQTGLRRPGQVEVVAGVAAGERIVTEGTQRLSDGVTVEERAAPGEPAPGAAPGAGVRFFGSSVFLAGRTRYSKHRNTRITEHRHRGLPGGA